MLENPGRWEITREMCERVVEEPEYTEEQENGLLRFWGYVPELRYYIRVITRADREDLINAFKDMNYTRRAGRRQDED